MKGKIICRQLSGFLVFCLIAAASTASAQPAFTHSVDPGTRIISYSATPQMLGNPDLTPRIQVFGDGWVWVHYPDYMKKAGDYELYLSAGELRQLLQVCSGVFDFDPAAVGQVKEVIKEARQQQDGIMYHRSDGMLEQIEVRLDTYRPSPMAAARGIDMKLSWKDIAADAGDYPEVADLQRLRGVRDSIRALLARDDLVRVDVRSEYE